MATLRCTQRTGFQFGFLTIMILLFALSDTAWAEIRPEYSGSWRNPSQSGHGFSIEVISPERSIVYWYTYDPFGYPIFLFGDGRNVGNRIEADVYAFHGMVFGEFDPATKVRLDWGTLSITFQNCNSATLRYDSTLGYETGESFGEGQIQLTRLVSIEGFKCSDYPMAGIYGGFAYSYWDDQSYHGHGIVNEDGELTFVSEDGAVLVGRLTAVGEASGSMSMGGLGYYFANGVVQIESFTASGNYNQDMIGAEIRNQSTGERAFVQVFKLNHLTGHSISMAELSGNWSAYSYISRQSIPVTISSSGTFSVTDQYGCVFNGQIRIPNSDLNIIDASATVTGCAQASGTFSGNGAYLENECVEFDCQDVMLFVASNGRDDAAVLRLTRN